MFTIGNSVPGHQVEVENAVKEFVTESQENTRNVLVEELNTVEKSTLYHSPVTVSSWGGRSSRGLAEVRLGEFVVNTFDDVLIVYRSIVYLRII